MFGDIFPPYVRGHLWVRRHRNYTCCLQEGERLGGGFIFFPVFIPCLGKIYNLTRFLKGHNGRLELNMDEHFKQPKNGEYSGELLVQRLIHMKLPDLRSGMFGRKHRGDSW